MKTNKLIKIICFFSFLLFSAEILAQNSVSGKVIDELNVPIAGANIIVKGTSVGTVTDFDGTYSIKASSGDVLVFSYVGYIKKQVTVSGATVNVTMEADINSLDQVVISSTRKPVRKLQATTAINSIGTADLQIKKPESFVEAIENVPGIQVDNATGRKGSFNIRGFPTGNVYITTLIDGLPASSIGNLSAGTQEFLGLDPNVSNVEIVRGAAATLFGRAASAGAVNIISRTGGAEHGGSFSLTKYNNVSGEGHQHDGDFDYRADFNFNGPINEKLRYNIGGYVLNDSGNKEQANKDTGAQIRANFDWLISDKTKIRFYGAYFNNQFQNVNDAPWDLGREEPGAGFSTYNTFFNDTSQLENDITIGSFSGTTPRDDNALIRNPADFTETTDGFNIGLDATFDLGSGWAVNQKLKYDRNNINDINEFTSTGFYTQDDTVNRLLAAAEQQTSGIISETRISKQINGTNATHNLNAGLYLSSGERDRLGFLYFYNSNVSTRPTFGGGFLLNSGLTSGAREEDATGIFIGDEIVFNEKLSVNVAFRYDWFRGSFINDPGEIRNSRTDLNRAPEDINIIDEKFEDYSGSIGVNYLVGEKSAVYANYLRAFAFPTIANNNFSRPEDTEVVKNFEVGYRAGLGDVTLDITGFNTNLDNRLTLVFDSASNEFIQAPAGSNKILGGELAVTYAPSAVKGLVINGGITLQKSEYKDFFLALSVPRGGTTTNVDQNGPLFGYEIIGSGTDAAINLKGNQVQRTPKAIYNLNMRYDRERWGASFNGFTYTGTYSDATNLLEQPNLSIYNLGGYVTFPMGGKNELRLSLLVKNIFDGENPVQLGLSSGDDTTLVYRQSNPTNVDGNLVWATLQNPKRVLFTVGYKF